MTHKRNGVSLKETYSIAKDNAASLIRHPYLLMSPYMLISNLGEVEERRYSGSSPDIFSAPKKKKGLAMRD